MELKPTYILEAKYFSLPFSSLVEEYPILNAFLISVDPPKFDLGDPRVLSLLNKYLFKEVVDLDINVPEDFLIPSLGIRHAYSDFIASRMKSNKPIIEIGTGASAAIAMILAKKYNKQVVATEIDPSSIEMAIANIKVNHLENKIEIIKSEGEIIKNLIPPGEYSSLVSFPPFYDTDLTKLEKKRGWKGTPSELFGGVKDGLVFARKLLEESFQSEGIEIDVISMMLMNKEQIKELVDIVPLDRKSEIIQINAGTRKRYILVIS